MTYSELLHSVKFDDIVPFISIYKAFTCAWLPYTVVCLRSSSYYPVTMEEMELVKLATQGCEEVQYCVKVDDNLAQELMINAAFYEN